MIQAQTFIAPDLALLPRLLITVLLIWLTGAVVGYTRKLLAFSWETVAHQRNRQNIRTRHRPTVTHHTPGNRPFG